MGGGIRDFVSLRRALVLRSDDTLGAKMILFLVLCKCINTAEISFSSIANYFLFSPILSRHFYFVFIGFLVNPIYFARYLRWTATDSMVYFWLALIIIGCFFVVGLVEFRLRDTPGHNSSSPSRLDFNHSVRFEKGLAVRPHLSRESRPPQWHIETNPTIKRQ